MEIRRLGPADWRTWRTVRLAALADAPYAFGSTLAREEAFDEAAWRRWLAPEKLTAVALADGAPIGAIGAFLPDPAGPPMLVALWVSPVLRGRGVGGLLVAEVVDWAREQGHPEVVLRVADGNDAARTLFRRHGFAPTGQREPLESDPSIGTEVLARRV
jgi:GNAT superfamily N-acetyltransferase